MKIITLKAENIKRLKAVEITPDGNTVVISGRNEQGKTSILDSIWLALAGGEASKDMPKPIRTGEKKASVVLDLGDLVVARTWTDNDKSYLKVDNKDGATFKSPQKMLDALVGRLSFDPLAFAQQDEKAQLKTLQELTGIDPAPLDARRKDLYDQRTDVNREVKKLEGQLAGIPVPSPDTPKEELSASEVLAELRAAQNQKNTNDEKRRDLQRLARQAKQHEADIENIDEQIKKLQEQREKANSMLTMTNVQGRKLQAEVDALAEPNLDVFQEKLDSVEQTNKAVRKAKEYSQVKASLDATKKNADSLTAQIEQVDAEKEKMLKAATFPIDGLGFDETGVTFKGIPFRQCSSAERLRVSLAMAMALNPKLRVIRIADGSLLDSENMRLIEEMAKGKDFQVWIEKVDESGKLGIYIEDGEIKSDAAKTA
jgi:predicted ATP-dependent endonuclease of OLD family